MNATRHLPVLAGTLLSLSFLVVPEHGGAGEGASRIRFTPLSKATSPALRSDYVRDVVQDVSGYVWIATDNGLHRFDGWEVVHYRHGPGTRNSLISNRLTTVCALIRDPGPVWIGTTDAGLMQFDPKSERVTVFSASGPAGRRLSSDHVTDLAVSQDRFVWIATDRGLDRLDLASGKVESVSEALEGAAISFVRCLGDSEIWVGTNRGGLFHWDAREAAFRETWRSSVPITDVARNSDQSLWIGTAGQGLYFFTGEKEAEPRPAPFGERQINTVYVDSRSELWVGTHSGLAQYDRRDGTFRWYRENPHQRESLADDQVETISEDRSRVLWVGTSGGGASRFSLERQWFPHLRPDTRGHPTLPHRTVHSFALSEDGDIWIGTSEGIGRWHPREETFLPPPDLPRLEDASISDLLVDRDGNKWIATRGNGLFRHGSDGKLELFRHDPEDPDSIGHDNVSCLHLTESGRFFAGAVGAGLSEFLLDSRKFRQVPSARKGHFTVAALAEDAEGQLWIATDDELQILLPAENSTRLYDDVFPEAAPLSSKRIRAILPERNGIVWLGTENAGLDRLNTRTGEVAHFTMAVHGLPDDSIRGLVKDRDGFLWVSTRSGVARLNALQNEFRVFSPEDGLQDEGFLPGACLVDREGRLYFGGNDGFNIIDPARVPPLPRAPNPILTGLEYFGEVVTPSPGGILEKEIAATDVIRLPYDPRLRFSIGFGNLDYHSPDRGYFRYKLEGHDFEWHRADETRKATYSGLSHGEYTFKVQSSADGREWPEVAARVDVHITPPWWMSWWFRILAIGALIGGTVFATGTVIRSRVRQLRRREAHLTAQRDRAEARLARQLQNRVLFERTASKLQTELQEDQILDEPLKEITRQFGATHCLVHRIVSRGETDETKLQQIGYFGCSLEAAGASLTGCELQSLLMDTVLKTTSVFASHSPEELPIAIRDAFPEGVGLSVLSSMTTFLEEPNGIVTLLRVGDIKQWDEDDEKLLEALTGQFGIAIAQIDTAATEKKYREHLQSARHEAEVANRAKSDFLAKMTHELRTPLNAIIGFSEILGEDRTLNARQRETLDIINNSGEHLLDVINEILDLSKIEAGKVEKNDEAFSFVPLLRSVYEMLAMKAESKRIGFHFNSGSDMPGEILTDRSKLRQILINLIGNAIKFTSQGAVSLSVRAVPLSEPAEVEHRLRRRLRIEFEVRDTGRGITQEELPRLFERYTQTESGRRTTEGTGLGLPIAKSFIELLGGKAEVESTFGEGTVFRFHIECDELAVAPASRQLSTSLDETSAQRIVGYEAAEKKEVRILVVEDQITNRLLLTKMLGKAGFTVAEASNGEEAVAKWAEWKPDLILMDEDMPIMRGCEATREIIAQAGREAPVIVSLTAYALEQARQQALEAGCQDFVAKPFRSHELFSVISKHLGVEYVFSEAV